MILAELTVTVYDFDKYHESIAHERVDLFTYNTIEEAQAACISSNGYIVKASGSS